MIEVSYKELVHPMFIKTLSKLYRTHGLPFKTSYTLSRICPKLEKELANALDLRDKLARQYGVVNEEGALVIDTESASGLKLKEGQEETFKKEIGDFLDQKVKLEFHPIPPETLEKADLSPMEWVFLTPVLAPETPEEEAGNGQDNVVPIEPTGT